jgi:hypothetical protein
MVDIEAKHDLLATGDAEGVANLFGNGHLALGSDLGGDIVHDS